MYYFAYGSLLNRERLLHLCPTARVLQRAGIPHHSLCFAGSSVVWGGGTATIGLVPNRYLRGGLYEVDEAGRQAIEESGLADGYVWAFTGVENPGGERIRTGLLIKVRGLERNDPAEAYLDLLKAGWRQWGFDPEALLADISATP